MSEQTEKKPAFDLKNFEKIEKIGSGSFGKVFTIKEKNTGEIYAAKVSQYDFNDLSHSEQVDLVREININAKLNHPAIIRFIGFSPVDFKGQNNIVITTEYIKNGSLLKYIQLDAKSQSPPGWDFTKKLIIAYGIAVGMSYLHLHNIIHRDLKAANILIDDNFHPKITDFGFSKSCDSNTLTQSGLKCTPLYAAPEVIISTEYTKAGDVYSYAILLYELFTKSEPFNNLSMFQIFRSVGNGTRPEITADIPEIYKELIENCWKQEPEERLTFDQIASQLKSEPKYITSEVNKEEFLKYVEFIDKYNVTFDNDKFEFKLDDFIQGKTRPFRRLTVTNAVPILREEDISLEEMSDDLDEEDVVDDVDDDHNEKIVALTPSPKKVAFEPPTNYELNQPSNQNLRLVQSQMFSTPQKPRKMKKKVKSSPSFKKSNRIVFPANDFRNLDEEGKQLVTAAEYNPELQFLVGKNLIEQLEGFPKNTQLGVKYIKNSMECECCDSILYYCQLLIDGQIIPKDVKKAKKDLKKSFKLNDSRLYLLYGKILMKENNPSKAKKYFNKASKGGNAEAQYEYGNLVLRGKGVKHNTKKAANYFELSKMNGINKSELFLEILNELEQIPNFSSLPDGVQQFFISQMTNYYSNMDNKSITPDLVPIYIPSNITSNIYKNKPSGFDDILSYFENIAIEIKFPSKKYHSIYSIISGFKKKNRKNLIVVVFITGSAEIDHKFGFNKIINRVIVDPSVHVLKSNIFSNCVKLSEIMISYSMSSIGEYVFSGCSSLVHITIPPSISSISKRAFSLCRSLKKIVIPSSVTKIHEAAFYGCSSLVEVEIPSTVKFIGSGCFDECSSLEIFEIPSSLTKINPLTFSGCSSIKKISIPSSVKVIDDYSFFGCSSLENVEIPSSVTLIGERAFFNCSSIKEIVVASSVESIKLLAFGGCKSLSKVSLPSSLPNVTSLGINQNLIK